MLKLEYTRNLPHFQRLGRCFFVTSTLKGSLPAEIVHGLQHKREVALRKLARTSAPEESDEATTLRKRYVAKIDAILDASRYGPRWLTDPQVGNRILAELHRLDGTDCTLLAACVMANHVHVIADMALQLERLQPEQSPDETNYQQLYQVLQRFKGRLAVSVRAF
jgi:hypothetical protein